MADGTDKNLVDVDGGGLGDGIKDRAGDVAGFEFRVVGALGRDAADVDQAGLDQSRAV
ncbi:hypothetical protein AB0D34_46965 [Streptomyces sp. NPDC048420]|uniref:hypothetical protein n=1 Tax=Streptomyces sp. NPDC048420 TaxID=3155755 RepID=UPI00342171E6